MPATSAMMGAGTRCDTRWAVSIAVTVTAPTPRAVHCQTSG